MFVNLFAMNQSQVQWHKKVVVVNCDAMAMLVHRFNQKANTHQICCFDGDLSIDTMSFEEHIKDIVVIHIQKGQVYGWQRLKCTSWF